MRDFLQLCGTFFIAVASLYAIGYGILLFASALIDKLNSISGDLSKALVASGFAIFSTVLTLVIGKVWEQRVKINQDIRDKKIPVYEEQIATFFSALFAAKFGKLKTNEKELNRAFVSFSQKLVIWGGPNVIKAWGKFKSHDWEASTPVESFEMLDSFLKAIRTEIGNSNSNLDDGELLKIFINDYDTYRKKIREAIADEEVPQ